ncbi:S1C family serine protease [Streptomyces sp. H27-D2]|uniref:S1C family serine protease n=1 Tax=Streptomyces sp. H27-D2 TaxID=3046304 RepID=UPI002DBC2225|nr:trypsin-like peptidase domain-containing protein [Streptomyces sp. H27-D2]MEC4019345.1 trypsin-like peptidase domain-containing protein [Streptomyces sp. H27-D2]
MNVSSVRGITRRLLLPVTAVLCAAALLGGCGGPDADTASTDSVPSAPASAARSAAAAPAAAAPDSANALQSAYQRVVKGVLPSVVQITTTSELGSGFVYDAKGHIVTNAHVVGANREFKVTLATGGAPVAARLVAAYPAQDLAVIKLNAVPRGLRPAPLADSARVSVGQIVLAMGNPLGLSSSVTQGIVSAVGRTVSESGTGATISDMVQTSAAINPGNSGGALVDLSGRVVGIPTLAATDPKMGEGAAPGIGFAIPASTVRKVADQIIRSGRVIDTDRAALGMTGRTVLSSACEPGGVAVVAVTAAGSAEKAGLLPGDVITKLGDTDIRTMPSLTGSLAADNPGDKMDLTFLRAGVEKTVQVTLGEL